MKNAKLEKIVIIRSVLMTWIPLLIIFLLPGSTPFSLIKIVLIILVIITVLSFWEYNFWWIAKGYETLEAFITQQTILFAILLFIQIPSLVKGILILWIINGFYTKFSQINQSNKTIDRLPNTPNDDDLKMLYRGFSQTTSYLLDKRKLSLVIDGIDLKQWQINMNYILSDISPHITSKIASVFLNEEKEQLVKKATPELKSILYELSHPISMHLPSSLKKDTHAWFIAAYPDVLNYFYPSPDYGKESLDNELKRVEKAKQVVDKQMEDFLNKIENKYSAKDHPPAYEAVLIELKDYYRNDLNKQFLLHKPKVKSEIPDKFTCTNCGRKINKLSNYCIHCGASLKG